MVQSGKPARQVIHYAHRIGGLAACGARSVPWAAHWSVVTCDACLARGTLTSDEARKRKTQLDAEMSED